MMSVTAATVETETEGSFKVLAEHKLGTGDIQCCRSQ